jgi:hypothetical protein
MRFVTCDDRAKLLRLKTRIRKVHAVADVTDGASASSRVLLFFPGL